MGASDGGEWFTRSLGALWCSFRSPQGCYQSCEPCLPSPSLEVGVGLFGVGSTLPFTPIPH